MGLANESGLLKVTYLWKEWLTVQKGEALLPVRCLTFFFCLLVLNESVFQTRQIDHYILLFFVARSH